ncbi:hypothetical protein WJX81_003946 [Elliptochloris bilobata]|uniref:Chromo domain-containing protein n=1 Tax=Elliptochloris bilobata TaxID=381761 RepID=A0AAW1SHM5_9CHLO
MWVVYTPGDELLWNYAHRAYPEYEESEVERIIDERRNEGGRKHFLVKYKGYELNPADWLDEGVGSSLQDLKALDEWEKLGCKYRKK